MIKDFGWTSHYRQAWWNLFTWWAHFGIQGFLFLQKTAGVNIKNILICYEFLFKKLCKFVITLLERVQASFVLNTVNISEENEKLARMTCTTLIYKAMKDTLKIVFSNISSVEYKTVPVLSHNFENLECY